MSLIARKADEPELSLDSVQVMHMLHALESKPGDVSSTVRLGFKWAAYGEGTGLFLCVCKAPCTDPDLCGRALWGDVQDENPARQSGGKKVVVEMPWTKEEEEVAFALWACDNCRPKGTGAIFDVWVGRFYDIPARLLQYEHENRSREYLGLRESMSKAYGDAFGEGSFVSLVLYRRVS